MEASPPGLLRRQKFHEFLYLAADADASGSPPPAARRAPDAGGDGPGDACGDQRRQKNYQSK
jgi:hypothetical protein